MPELGWVDAVVGREPSPFVWAVLAVIAAAVILYSPPFKAFCNWLAGWAERRKS